MHGCWRHADGDHMNCNPWEIRWPNQIDDPRCHICGTQSDKHAGACSATGLPPFSATPMSQKEDELIKMFGWRP
jgi:hypothetical protein